MKSLKIIFFFTAAIALGVSCKNDKTSQSEEKASPPIEEVKTNPNNSITAVEKLYTTLKWILPHFFQLAVSKMRTNLNVHKICFKIILRII